MIVVEMYFIFSMIWSLCAAVDEEGRKKIDSYLREMEGSFPNKVSFLLRDPSSVPVGKGRLGHSCGQWSNSRSVKGGKRNKTTLRGIGVPVSSPSPPPIVTQWHQVKTQYRLDHPQRFVYLFI